MLSYLKDIKNSTENTKLIVESNTQILVTTGKIKFEINWIENFYCHWYD